MKLLRLQIVKFILDFVDFGIEFYALKVFDEMSSTVLHDFSSIATCS